SNTLPDNPDAPDFLLDTYHSWKMGGTGEKANWAIAQVVARRFKLLLAGGLTPETVADAIHTVQPWGVDVVSGVESAPGVKDHDRVREFIRQVKAAAQGSGEMKD
ncbi:MAG: phosphoribosylanthranilate isomerase, partial [Ardenticatenales bacterium]|nr:phosphoribosylanthranilate isomerase [Ardenticatenales bacterium]